MDNEKPSYKTYVEYNKSLEYERENIDINEKSSLVRVSKPKNDIKSTSLTDKLLIDVAFPSGYLFSIAGREQIQDIEEFQGLFTLHLTVLDKNKNELSPESRVIIHKEKDIDEYETDVVRLESTFYKNISKTKFLKENKNLPNSIKTTGELYKLRQGAEFKGGDHLRVYVIDSEIDINPKNVEFGINMDKWNSYNI